MPAQAAPNTSTAPVTQPASFWGVEIDRTSYPLLTSKLVTRLRKAGVNTLVVRPGTLTAAQTAQVRTLAARGGLSVLVPRGGGLALVGRDGRDRECRLPGAQARLRRKPLRRLRQDALVRARHRSARRRRRRPRQGRPRLAQGPSHRARAASSPRPRSRQSFKKSAWRRARMRRPLRPRRRSLGRASAAARRRSAPTSRCFGPSRPWATAGFPAKPAGLGDHGSDRLDDGARLEQPPGTTAASRATASTSTGPHPRGRRHAPRRCRGFRAAART